MATGGVLQGVSISVSCLCVCTRPFGVANASSGYGVVCPDQLLTQPSSDGRQQRTRSHRTDWLSTKRTQKRFTGECPKTLLASDAIQDTVHATVNRVVLRTRILS